MRGNRPWGVALQTKKGRPSSFKITFPSDYRVSDGDGKFTEEDPFFIRKVDALTLYDALEVALREEGLL